MSLADSIKAVSSKTSLGGSSESESEPNVILPDGLTSEDLPNIAEKRVAGKKPGIWQKIKDKAHEIASGAAKACKQFLGEDSFIVKATTSVKNFIKDKINYVKTMFTGNDYDPQYDPYEPAF